MTVFQPPNLPNWVLGPVFMRLDDREVGFPDIPKRSLRPPSEPPKFNSLITPFGSCSGKRSTKVRPITPVCGGQKPLDGDFISN